MDLRKVLAVLVPVVRAAKTDLKPPRWVDLRMAASGSSAQQEWDMYIRFGISLMASLVAMYFLAFSQIDVLGHFDWSLSVFWISMSMVSAMGLIMLAAMWRMMPMQRVNVALAVGFALLLVLAFTASRYEAIVGDDAFLGSMIPHHSRAIHMCQEAAITDAEIKELCDGIIRTQREEIVQMRDIQARRG